MPITPSTTGTLMALLVAVAPRTAAPAADPPKLKTQSVAIRLPDGPGPKIDLVQIPPGKITLKGADGKEHEHEIKPIWIARYETRWDEYDVFAFGLDVPRDEWPRVARDERRTGTRPDAPFSPPHAGVEPDGSLADWGGDGFPAHCIHFQAAVKYCRWLSKHTGRKFRLPTEAEWEYACRAGGPPLKPDAKALHPMAWFAGNAGNKTHAVGQKQPNAWGLYDMLGNVGEFVVRDPNDDKGVLAGGSYKDQAKDVHSGAREPYSPDWQTNDFNDPKSTSWLNWTVSHVGFRVVMED